MELSKKVLSIYRVLEALPNYDTLRIAVFTKRAGMIMTDEEKVMMGNIGKAMILLTAGNQKAVRDPNSFNQADALDSYVALTDGKMWRAIEKIGLDIGLNDKPTKEDYELAHKLLPHMGASIVTHDDVEMNLGASTVSDLKYATSGKPILYRGLNNLDVNTLKYVVDKNTWDMTRGVSTSYDPKEAHKFAGMKPGAYHASTRGPAVLFVIDNKSKRGFHASSLSKYGREREVILSGNMKVNSVEVQALGHPDPGNFVDGMKGQLSRIELMDNPAVRVTLSEKSNLGVFGSKDSKFNHSMPFPHQGKSFGDFVDEMLDTMKIKNYVSANSGLHDLHIQLQSVLVIAQVELE